MLARRDADGLNRYGRIALEARPEPEPERVRQRKLEGVREIVPRELDVCAASLVLSPLASPEDRLHAALLGDRPAQPAVHGVGHEPHGTIQVGLAGSIRTDHQRARRQRWPSSAFSAMSCLRERGRSRSTPTTAGAGRVPTRTKAFRLRDSPRRERRRKHVRRSLRSRRAVQVLCVTDSSTILA